MPKSVLFCLSFLLLFGQCKKENSVKVEIYLLQSFTRTINQATSPVTITLTNAVLADAPLVADSDIAWYDKETATFKIKKNLRPQMQNLGPDKAFAVTVNKVPVYYGVFHPAYMSSLVFGLATIDPLFFHNNELVVRYVRLTGGLALEQLDKRNDGRLLAALKASGRLR